MQKCIPGLEFNKSLHRDLTACSLIQLLNLKYPIYDIDMECIMIQYECLQQDKIRSLL